MEGSEADVAEGLGVWTVGWAGTASATVGMRAVAEVAGLAPGTEAAGEARQAASPGAAATAPVVPVRVAAVRAVARVAAPAVAQTVVALQVVASMVAGMVEPTGWVQSVVTSEAVQRAARVKVVEMGMDRWVMAAVAWVANAVATRAVSKAAVTVEAMMGAVRSGVGCQVMARVARAEETRAARPEAGVRVVARLEEKSAVADG